MIPIATPIAVVAESPEQVEEAFMRLARVGHETVKGYILFENYDGEARAVEQVSCRKSSGMPGDNLQFVDVRRSAEYAAGMQRTRSICRSINFQKRWNS